MDDVDPQTLHSVAAPGAILVGRVPLRCVRICRPTSPQGRIRTRILLGLGLGKAANRGLEERAHTETASDWKSLQAGLFGMRGERHLKALLLDPQDYCHLLPLSSDFSRFAGIAVIAAF